MSFLRTLIAIFVLIALSYGTASAQFSIRQNEETGEIERFDETDPEFAVPKEPKTPEDFANLIYQNCINQQDSFFHGEEQEMYCGCISAQSMEVMTPTQILASAKDTNEGEIQRQRLMYFVYAPCTEYPTRSLVLESCLGNAESYNAPEKTCACLSQMMGEFIQNKSSNVIQLALHTKTEGFDPVKTILESPHYRAHQKYAVRACTGKFEYKRTGSSRKTPRKKNNTSNRSSRDGKVY